MPVRTTKCRYVEQAIVVAMFGDQAEDVNSGNYQYLPIDDFLQ